MDERIAYLMPTGGTICQDCIDAPWLSMRNVVEIFVEDLHPEDECKLCDRAISTVGE